MANPSTNKVAMNNEVRFSLAAATEKTIVLPRACNFVEIVNDDKKDIYFALGDRIAGPNAESRLMTSAMNSIIVKPFFAQDNQGELFTEISLYCAENANISFMNLSPTSLT